MIRRLPDFTSNDNFDHEFSDDITSTTDFLMPSEDVVQSRSRRRQFDINDGPPAKRHASSERTGSGFKWNLQTLSSAADAVAQGKSPTSVLNELGLTVSYRVNRQDGPAHSPNFTISVTVSDMTFEGYGHSKREARSNAARACLAALLARAGRGRDSLHLPLSQIQHLDAKKERESSPVKPLPPPRPASPPKAASPLPSLFSLPSSALAVKSPINVLYETCPNIVFHCTYGDGTPLDSTKPPMQLSHSMRFKVVCQMKGQVFEGYGSSKKLAKLAAARSALSTMDEGRPVAAPLCGAEPLPQTLADHISKLVNVKFAELMSEDPIHIRRKVLAGIVITENNQIENAKVIAVTTGTKCISGEHMSVTGRVLNDCHAEVAARRCLQRYLYSQLAEYANSDDPRTPIPHNDLQPIPSGGYRLRENRRIHLYVSTAPCGDGRIFSPHEPDSNTDKHPNRMARGQLRTKIESGEGTIPVKNCSNNVQTWDGIMQGERLLTMSCSDKLARWCAVGLQGALLSRVLQPVYLHSLVLGSLLHAHHLYRAVVGRTTRAVSALPPPFRVSPPALCRTASCDVRSVARAPTFSVLYCYRDQTAEIVNATTGKLDNGLPSLLCKQSMFARWLYIVKRVPSLPQEPGTGCILPDLPPSIDHILYSDAKQLCPAYQLAKQRLIDGFERAKYGRWVKKPIEQDQFLCEITDVDPSLLFS